MALPAPTPPTRRTLAASPKACSTAAPPPSPLLARRRGRRACPGRPGRPTRRRARRRSAGPAGAGELVRLGGADGRAVDEQRARGSALDDAGEHLADRRRPEEHEDDGVRPLDGLARRPGLAGTAATSAGAPGVRFHTPARRLSSRWRAMATPIRPRPRKAVLMSGTLRAAPTREDAAREPRARAARPRPRPVRRARPRAARAAGQGRRPGGHQRARRALGPAARHGAPAARDAGVRRVRPPGRRPPVRARHRAHAARRCRHAPARRLGAAVPRPPGRGQRGDGEPRGARRRPGALPRPGAGPAPDAHVHRGRAPGAPHTTAVGKVLLAWQDEAQVRRVLARTASRPAPRTASDRPGLPRRPRRGARAGLGARRRGGGGGRALRRAAGRAGSAGGGRGVGLRAGQPAEAADPVLVGALRTVADDLAAWLGGAPAGALSALRK